MHTCLVLSDAGFFSGLLHGLIAFFTLPIDIFWEVTVYQHCQQSWWYDFGFLIGVGVFVVIGWEVAYQIVFLGFFLLLISFVRVRSR